MHSHQRKYRHHNRALLLNYLKTVGLTGVTVKYSRPSKKGRDIFGALVPFGEIWRTGANQNTIISFSDAVTIADQEIAAGEYAIYTRPGKATWEVFFYKETTNWGTPGAWDAAKVAATVEVAAVDTDNIESFEIWISKLHNNGANFEYRMEHYYGFCSFWSSYCS